MEAAGVFRQSNPDSLFFGKQFMEGGKHRTIILFTSLQTYSFFYHLQEFFLSRFIQAKNELPYRKKIIQKASFYIRSEYRLNKISCFWRPAKIETELTKK
jgi:hypothetical protein